MMKPIVRQCFHDVYGEYLKSHGFIKKREVYYKIDWEKKFIYHVGLIIFKGGHDFDVFMGMDPFCSFEYEFPCESDMRVGDFCCRIFNEHISFVYEKNTIEEIHPKINTSFFYFCKIATQLKSKVDTLENYYQLTFELNKIYYKFVPASSFHGYIALKLHLYDLAENNFKNIIPNYEKSINYRGKQFNEWKEKYGEKYIIENYSIFYKSYKQLFDDKKLIENILSKLKEKNYDALDKLIEEREKQTEEKIYAYFGNKIRPESSKE